MSTYYYAVCDKHRAVSEMTARQPLIGDREVFNDELERFLTEHDGCTTHIVTEHDDRTYDYSPSS